MVIALLNSAYSIDNFATYSNDTKPYNLTYGDWTARWWQWFYSIPRDVNPFNDVTGINCAQYQSGPVWFLTGTTGNGAGGSANLTCTLPAGKSILVPIINWECSFAESGHGQKIFKTGEGLRACAEGHIDKVLKTEAIVDNLKANITRIGSPIFNLTFAPNNIVGINATITQAVGDGYYVFLQPLSVGKHEIRIRGLAIDHGKDNNFYVQDIVYNLTVK